MGHDETTGDSVLEALPEGLLHHILSAIDEGKDMASALQTCKILKDAGEDAIVWRTVAARMWPPQTLTAPCVATYGSMKALVLHGNKKNAAYHVNLEGKACDYKYSRPLYYFQCRLIGFQWWRGNDCLRLYFDARGERDLRSPIGSSLAVVETDDTCRPCGRGGDDAAAHPGCASDAGAHGGGAGSDAGSHPGGAGNGAGVTKPWLNNLGAFYPDGAQLYAGKPGHCKGCLVWHASKCRELLRLLQQRKRCSLLFCYANNLGDPGHLGSYNYRPDYTYVELLNVQPGQGMDEAWLSSRGSSVQLSGALDEALQRESEDAERQRWLDLPPEVRQRGNGWWV